MYRRLTAFAAIGGLMFAGAACSNDDEGRGDAPVGKRLEEPRDVLVMPDRFANLAVACDGTTRIYVTTRANTPPVAVPNSPECGYQPPFTPPAARGN